MIQQVGTWQVHEGRRPPSLTSAESADGCSTQTSES